MKEKQKGGRFQKKTADRKGGIFWIVIPALLILAAAGWMFFGGSEPVDPAETMEPQQSDIVETTAATTETTVPVTEPDPMTVYGDIFRLYAQAVSEEWEFDTYEANRISYMVMFQENLERLGYYFVDLNGDGISELIISDGNVIYDLYAQVNGEIIWVVSGAERNSWQLCEGNILKNTGSNGAASSIFAFMTWDGEKLVLERNIIFNGMAPEPWTTTYAGSTQIITEDEANGLMESYPVIRIPLEALPE